MAYNEDLAGRVRSALKSQRGVTEKKMFGGLSFLLNGNMCCGIVGERLCVRVGPDAHEEALTRNNVTPMDFTGKPMRGMVYVLPEGLKTDPQIAKWVRQAVEFVGGLPTKSK